MTLADVLLGMASKPGDIAALARRPRGSLGLSRSPYRAGAGAAASRNRRLGDRHRDRGRLRAIAVTVHGHGRPCRHRADGAAPRCGCGGGRDRARGRAALQCRAGPGRDRRQARGAGRRDQCHSRPLRAVARYSCRRRCDARRRGGATCAPRSRRSPDAEALRSMSTKSLQTRGRRLRAAPAGAVRAAIRARRRHRRRATCRAAPATTR